jgi:hypothetical protein
VRHEPCDQKDTIPSRGQIVADPDVQSYYADPDVRARIREACGSDTFGLSSAVYLATIDFEDDPHVTWATPRRCPVADLESLLDGGHDVARSLWDTRHLVFLIDLDHQNLDNQAESFLHPDDAFIALEPTFRAVRAVSERWGLDTQAVMTGRGYHFVGVVPLGHPIVDRLARLSPDVPSWWHSHARRRPDWAPAISERHARAHAGLGMIVEYAAGLIHDRAAPASPVPVTLNGTVVGLGVRGREAVSIDFSHLGDPLDMRQFRVCFSAYQWHRSRPDIFGAAADLAPLVVLPRTARSLQSTLRDGRDVGTARRRARLADSRLPDIADGLERMLDEYLDSPLGEFHRRFYDDARSGAVGLDHAPPCVARCIEWPNDLLLKPEHIQHLVRWGLSDGATARQVAELVFAAYESDHGWGDRWTRLDARTRAEFDVRVFAGLVETGRDRLVDFNCVSAQEKDVCPRVGCPHDLRDDRERLIHRGHL